jgi:hypothetical protein
VSGFWIFLGLVWVGSVLDFHAARFRKEWTEHSKRGDRTE